MPRNKQKSVTHQLPRVRPSGRAMSHGLSCLVNLPARRVDLLGGLDDGKARPVVDAVGDPVNMGVGGAQSEEVGRDEGARKGARKLVDACRDMTFSPLCKFWLLAAAALA